jgi:hypothetical protein
MDLWIVRIPWERPPVGLARALAAWTLGLVVDPMTSSIAAKGGYLIDHTLDQGRVMQRHVVSEAPREMQWAVDPHLVSYVDGHYYLPGGSHQLSPLPLILGADHISFSFAARPSATQLHELQRRLDSFIDLAHELADIPLPDRLVIDPALLHLHMADQV